MWYVSQPCTASAARGGATDSKSSKKEKHRILIIVTRFLRKLCVIIDRTKVSGDKCNHESRQTDVDKKRSYHDQTPTQDPIFRISGFTMMVAPARVYAAGWSATNNMSGKKEKYHINVVILAPFLRILCDLWSYEST